MRILRPLTKVFKGYKGRTMYTNDPTSTKHSRPFVGTCGPFCVVLSNNSVNLLTLASWVPTKKEQQSVSPLLHPTINSELNRTPIKEKNQPISIHWLPFFFQSPSVRASARRLTVRRPSGREESRRLRRKCLGVPRLDGVTQGTWGPVETKTERTVVCPTGRCVLYDTICICIYMRLREFTLYINID